MKIVWLSLLTVLLGGCAAKEKCQFRCERMHEQCMDVCKDHVTTPTVVDLEENQTAKVGCLDFCFQKNNECMKSCEGL